MSRDVEKGIGTLLGYETPETKRVRDLHYLNQVKQIIEGPLEPLGETLARTTPSLNLGVKPEEETREPKGFRSQKEYEKHLISSPSKTQHMKALREGKRILEDKKLIKWALEESPEPIVKNPYLKKAIAADDTKRNKWANEWMTGGGRDPKGRSLDQEIKLGKDTWLKNQKTINELNALKKWAQPKPVGLGDNYKSDIRTPVQKKRDSYNAKVGANKAKTDPTKGARYLPWYERMAQEEAEALNNIKRTTWEQGGKVNPEPKYVNAQDVQNVYDQPKASPVQMKQLHQRLENHNERTGEFKSTVEKPTHKPRFLHNPVTNELEDTYDPNWGDDILNEK